MKWSSAQTYECMLIAHVSITAYLHLQCKKVNMKDKAKKNPKKKNKNQKLSLKQITLECKKKDWQPCYNYKLYVLDSIRKGY